MSLVPVNPFDERQGFHSPMKTQPEQCGSPVTRKKAKETGELSPLKQSNEKYKKFRSNVRGSLPSEAIQNENSNSPIRIGRLRLNGKNFQTLNSLALDESKTILREMKKQLDETLKKQRNIKFIEKSKQNQIVDDNYEDVGIHHNKNEDKEHVKNLDRWRLQVKRNKSMIV